MKHYLAVCVLCMAAGLVPVRAAELTWKQTASSLALLDGGKVVWQFNCEKGEGKPYFHPLTVAGSPSLTALRPADHPWHLALWFSWKFINGVNYWEPDPTGRSAGTTEVLDLATSSQPDYSARFQLKLAYHPPGQPPVLTESRTIEVSPPDATGSWHIDWRSRYTAGGSDVQLDRTPIVGETNGVSYGGYAGLSLRLSPELSKWQFVGAEGPTSAAHVHSRWMAFSGDLPGGTPARESAATILVLEHPRSFRHPTTWYLIGFMPYFSPAILYDSSYVLPAGKSIDVLYRIVLQPGKLDAKAAEESWKRFAVEMNEKLELDSRGPQT